MPDVVLFRIRNRILLTTSHLYLGSLLLCFALFMIGGNFFRFIPLPPFPSHFSLLEPLLYLLSVPLYFAALRKSHLLVGIIVLSSLYGTCLHGFHLTSVLYSLKLIGMISSGCAIGDALYRLGAKRNTGLKYFLWTFVGVLIFGGIIFLFFPEASRFFTLLEKYGIHFTGDPHSHRFISPFFDPNYYSAIACIPLILAAHFRKWTLFFLFFISIFLSFSRSGIATCCLLLLVIYRPKICGKDFFLAICCTVFLFLYKEEVATFLHRSIHLFEDPSALARLHTFQIGLSYFLKHPLFGVGYNYLSSSLLEDHQFLTPDSSLLVTLINFGLVPTLCLATFLFLLPLRSKIERTLSLYLAACIFFTSQFNNLLYYPYWLIPIIGIFTFLQRTQDEHSTCA